MSQYLRAFAVFANNLSLIPSTPRQALSQPLKTPAQKISDTIFCLPHHTYRQADAYT